MPYLWPGSASRVHRNPSTPLSHTCRCSLRLDALFRNPSSNVTVDDPTKTERTLDEEERIPSRCRPPVQQDNSRFHDPPAATPKSSLPFPMPQCRIHDLQKMLPMRYQSSAWSRLFDTHTDGYSLSHFYATSEHHIGAVLLFFDVALRESPLSTRATIGCFSSVTPSLLHGPTHFFGSRETFVFSSQTIPQQGVDNERESPNFKSPNESKKDLRAFRWTGTQNEEFLICSHHYLGIGGGEVGAAIFVDHDLQFGTSSVNCATFNSPPLIGDAGKGLHHSEFVVLRFLCFSLERSSNMMLQGDSVLCTCGNLNSTHVCSF